MILAILQARYSSSRLPNKVLKPILGKPMLFRQIERIRHSQTIDKIVVATSSNALDDPIENMCRDNGIDIFRGELDNVLDRFYQCAKLYKPEYIIRLTGDCPLIDWEVIDSVVRYCINKDFDFVETSLAFPDGLDTEIMTMSALSEAWRCASLPSEIEHVTQYIINRSDKFNNGVFESSQNLSHLRWTVDELEDFELVSKIYQELYVDNPFFLTSHILALLRQNPELSMINEAFTRNEGLQKSLKEDENFLKNV